jgi:hypothetical protein
MSMGRKSGGPTCRGPHPDRSGRHIRSCAVLLQALTSQSCASACGALARPLVASDRHEPAGCASCADGNATSGRRYMLPLRRSAIGVGGFCEPARHLMFGHLRFAVTVGRAIGSRFVPTGQEHRERRIRFGSAIA